MSIFNGVSKDTKTNATEWLSWYHRNQNDLYPTRKVEQNGDYTAVDTLSLGMAKDVCADWVFLLTQEIEFNDDFKNVEEFFNKTDADLLIEGTFATGQGLAVYLDDTLAYYNASQYEYRNEKIDGVAVEVLVVELEDNKELILNDKLAILRDLTKANDHYYKLNYKPYKFLTFLKDLQYPNAKAIFADSIDVIKQIDLTYTDMNDDREFSKPMVLMANEAYKMSIEEPTPAELTKDENAQPKIRQWIHKGKRIFKGFNWNGKNGAPPITKVDFNMQVDNYIKALNAHLSLLSKKCKLGQDYYTFDKATNSIKTATEVIDKNSELARNLRKFRNTYKKFMKEFYEQVFNVELDEDYCFFGDAILTDDKYERDMALKEISEFDSEYLAIEYLIKYKGYSKEDAQQALSGQQYQDEEVISDDITRADTERDNENNQETQD